MRANIGSKRRRRENYWTRWYKNHPRISIYLNREEYEALKKLSNELGLSYREILLNAIDTTEKMKHIYNEAYEKAIQDLINTKINEETLKKHGVEYLHCTICGKPLEGFIVPVNNTFSNWIKYGVIKYHIHHEYHDKETKVIKHG